MAFEGLCAYAYEHRSVAIEAHTTIVSALFKTTANRRVLGRYSHCRKGGGKKRCSFFRSVSAIRHCLIGSAFGNQESRGPVATHQQKARGFHNFAWTDRRCCLQLLLFYLGVFGTVVGFVWYYEGIKSIGPSRASQFINLVPVSAIVLAFFLLDEPITASLAIGAALVVVGVYITNSLRA
jgi:hypothetical protein